MAERKPRKKPTRKRPVTKNPQATVSVDFGGAIANLESRARAAESSGKFNRNLMIGVASAVALTLAIIATNVEIVVVRTVDPQQIIIATARVSEAEETLGVADASVNDALKRINEAKRQKTIGQANLNEANEAAKNARKEAMMAAAAFDAAVQRKEQAEANKKIASEALESASIADRDALGILKAAKEKRDKAKKAWDDAEATALESIDAAGIAAAEVITALDEVAAAEPARVEELRDKAITKEVAAAAFEEIAEKTKAKAAEAQAAYEEIRDEVGNAEKVAAPTAKNLADKEATADSATEEFNRANDALTAARDKDNAAKNELKRAELNLNDLKFAFARAAAGWAEAISQAETQLDEANAALRKVKQESKDAAEFKSTVDRGVTDITTTAIRSSLIAAAVGMIILLIQNFANSMRFYARLTEFYGSQADALLAANGDAELSISYLKELPPKGIDFGKTPTSLYEKVIDMVTKKP